MNVDAVPALPNERTRWLPYFLLALGLHGLVLAAPLPGGQSSPAGTAPSLQARLLAGGPPAAVAGSGGAPAPAPPVQARREPSAPQAAVKPNGTMAPAEQAVVPETAPGPAAETAAPPASAGQRLAEAGSSGNAPLVPPRHDAAYLRNPPPDYPPLSRRLGEEGRVVLKVRVSVDGQALSVDLAQSSGFFRLDHAARQAVSGWRFLPARRGAEAVEASLLVPLIFRLEG